MCSYYARIDIKLLSTSNPFSEEYPSPAEAAMPNNIIVESPESQRHTAWTNLRRFPSLSRRAPPANTESSNSSPGYISIRGPRELAKQTDLSCDKPFRPQQQPAAIDSPSRPSSSTSSKSSPHKLQHHNRVDSLQSIYSPDHDHSSDTSTPRPMSPVSEDEFSYLSSSHERSTKAKYTPFVRDGSRAVSVAEEPLPPPLKIRRAEQSSSAWMDQLCQKL